MLLDWKFHFNSFYSKDISNLQERFADLRNEVFVAVKMTECQSEEAHQRTVKNAYSKATFFEVGTGNQNKKHDFDEKNVVDAGS